MIKEQLLLEEEIKTKRKRINTLEISSYELADEEKNVLSKGLNFSVKAALIEYSQFLLPFEL